MATGTYLFCKWSDKRDSWSCDLDGSKWNVNYIQVIPSYKDSDFGGNPSGKLAASGGISGKVDCKRFRKFKKNHYEYAICKIRKR